METPADVNEESVSVNKTTAEEENSGQNSVIPDEDDVSVVGKEFRTNGSRRYNGTVLERFATSTECLGFESSGEYVHGGDLTAETAARSRSTIGRPRLNRNSFPPLLTILNRNGRPRFNLKKIREDGRLRMVLVPNNWPEALRSSRRDGRLKMQLIHGDDREAEDHEEVELPDVEDDREVREIESGETS